MKRDGRRGEERVLIWGLGSWAIGSRWWPATATWSMFFDRVVGLQEGLVVWFGAFKTGPASSGVCRAGRLLATEPGMARKKTRGGE